MYGYDFSGEVSTPSYVASEHAAVVWPSSAEQPEIATTRGGNTSGSGGWEN